MFSIEHEFDSTVVTVIDEGNAPLREDIVVNSFEDCITLEQFDPIENRVHKITFSISQMQDLAAAIELPEGLYQRGEDGS
jgi:hypothetical protein